MKGAVGQTRDEGVSTKVKLVDTGAPGGTKKLESGQARGSGQREERWGKRWSPRFKPVVRTFHMRRRISLPRRHDLGICISQEGQPEERVCYINTASHLQRIVVRPEWDRECYQRWIAIANRVVSSNGEDRKVARYTRQRVMSRRERQWRWEQADVERETCAAVEAKLSAARIPSEASEAKRIQEQEVGEQRREETRGEAIHPGPPIGAAMTRRRRRQRAEERLRKPLDPAGPDDEEFKVMIANVHGLMPRLADVVQWGVHALLLQETEVPQYIVGPTIRGFLGLHSPD